VGGELRVEGLRHLQHESLGAGADVLRLDRVGREAHVRQVDDDDVRRALGDDGAVDVGGELGASRTHRRDHGRPGRRRRNAGGDHCLERGGADVGRAGLG